METAMGSETLVQGEKPETPVGGGQSLRYTGPDE
jgi:hypothetical protein